MTTKTNLVAALTKLTDKEKDGVKLNRKERRAKAKLEKQLAKR